MRVLIVEDDPQLLAQLAQTFNKRGWAVDSTTSGQDAQYLGDEYALDLAVVDLGLPDASGLEIIRHWRSRDRRFPILILTARSDWRDKVEGLEAGADDYVTKPFHTEELIARANALVRRAVGRATTSAEFGPVRINFSARSVTLNGTALELTSYEYNTLEYLAQRAGQVVSKTELTEHLYDQDFDRDSNVIEVFVARLRKKLDPDGQLKPIRTIRGAGYKLDIPGTHECTDS